MSSFETAYHVALLLILSIFAAYDYKTRRVPDKALVFFIPFALAAPLFKAVEFVASLTMWPTIAIHILLSVSGLTLGGGILLMISMLTDGSIGGGDIKLTALLGFICGPNFILLVLAISSVAAACFGFIKSQRDCLSTSVRIAFVPFLFFGISILTIFKIFM